jgi:hypothetical protein
MSSKITEWIKTIGVLDFHDMKLHKPVLSVELSMSARFYKHISSVVILKKQLCKESLLLRASCPTKC